MAPPGQTIPGRSWQWKAGGWPSTIWNYRLRSKLGSWKVKCACVSPWFLPSPEICFGTSGHVLHEAIVHILQVRGYVQRIYQQLYAGICTVYIICINMHIYAIRKICKNMQLKICINMHKICNKYAVPHDYASNVKICKNMQKKCNYMQDMPTWFLYAKYALPTLLMEAEESRWFGKYIKCKRHEETRTTCLL